MASLQIATYNVRGIRDTMKRRCVFNFLHDQNLDVIYIQESHSSPNCEKYWRSEWGGKIYYAHGTTASGGTMIMFKKGITPKIHDIVRDVTGKYIIIKVEIDKRTLALACCYAPNDDNVTYFDNFFNQLVSVNADGVIIGGDFNTILHDRDIKGGKGHTHINCTHYINERIQHEGWVDIWRIRHPNDFRFTWARSKPHVIMERIDFFLISFHLQQFVVSTDILSAYRSDHNLPIIWLNLEHFHLEKGKGRWMFNNSLLDDDDFVTREKELLNELNEEIKDPVLRWEMMKIMTRGWAIQCASRKKKSREKTLNRLEKKLSDIENQQSASCQLFLNHEAQANLIRKDIEDIRYYKTKGAIVRTASQWLEHGEKSSRFFFNLEKNRAQRKTIQKLIPCDVQDMQNTKDIIENNDGIMDEIHKYYKNLFAHHQVNDNSDFLDDLKLPQVSKEDNMMLNSPILLEEMLIAIRQLAKDKCPGPDGFSMNFMARFLEDIKYTLHSVILRIVEDDLMFQSGRQGTVALMEKLTKNSMRIFNWRPLVMLNSDDKIYAKIIANRLQTVLPYLISNDQVGFMKGRNITKNLTELLTTIEYCKQNKIQALLISVDFEKAFDTVSWSAMTKVLKAFGFGEYFIKLIMICYRDFEVRVGNNGHFTEPLQIFRGNKQGCPLSALKFLLIIETIGRKFTQCKDIQPAIQTKTNLRKILSQYADDLWTATKLDKKSFDAQFRLFKDFQEFSGLCINYSKTEIMRIGATTGSNAEIYSRLPLTWSDGPIKVLGMWFYPNMKDTIERNYGDKIEKIQNIFKIWRKRSLTLIGKVLVINTLAVSQMLYCLQVLPMPSKMIIDRYNDLVRHFLWDDKKTQNIYGQIMPPIS